jgi:uncharacterized protein (TIGR00299 family) protein
MLYFDCFSGASGDMILGAFLDLGLPLEGLRAALGSLAIEHGPIATDRVKRAGVTATKFQVSAAADSGQADGHKHYHLKHIVAAIRRSALSPENQERAVGLFERLAEAEASIHGTPIEKVHLHEVGALDSIIDIVGAVYAFDWFGTRDVVVSPLNVGGGTVECAHGTFPVPAPATARLLAGVPIYGKGTMEMVTPTGALLLTGYAREWGEIPVMSVERIGYGAGDRDPKGTPNVLRIMQGTRAEASDTERIVKLECEVDDMNPQLFGPLMNALLAAGAHDVYYTPVQMKKNRPGTLVTVIARPDLREALTSVLFRESTSIGIRHEEMARTCLERVIQTVDTPYGTIRVKVARRDGRVLNVAPEFDDCVRAAGEHGASVKDVQATAVAAGFAARTS